VWNNQTLRGENSLILWVPYGPAIPGVSKEWIDQEPEKSLYLMLQASDKDGKALK
jgi:hypothetical protein